MIGSYLIFAVLGFILISTFTAHYNQIIWSSITLLPCAGKAVRLQILSETATIDLS